MVKKTLPKNRKVRDIDQILDYRLESTPHRAREWTRKNSLKIAQKIYGTLFYNIAIGKQLSERYANSLEIKLANKYSQGGKLKLVFKVNYFDEETGNIPLWAYFEYGTKRHFIEPKNAKALRWGTGSSAGQSQTSTSRLASGSAGETVYAFSKGHFVSGIKPRKVLYWTLKRGNKPFGNALMKGLRKFLKDNATELGV